MGSEGSISVIVSINAFCNWGLSRNNGFTPKYLRPAMVFVRSVVLNFFLIVPYIVTLGILLVFLFNIRTLTPGTS